MENRLVLFLILVTLFSTSALTSSLILLKAISAQEELPRQFKAYSDSQGRFYFSYPSEWQLDVPENRFTKTSEVEVSAPDNITGWAAIDVRILEGLADTADSLGLDNSLDIGLRSARNDVPDFKVLENIECKKYRINSEETCSVQYTRGLGSSFSGVGGLSGYGSNDDNSNSLLSMLGRHAIQQVVFPVGEDIYMLTYGADFDNFDKYLPTIEKIYSTFRAGESSNDDNNNNEVTSTNLFASENGSTGDEDDNNDTNGNGGNCDPSYPDVCILSPPPRLNCGDIPYNNVRVLPPDPHGLDGNDNDGIGCEDGNAGGLVGGEEDDEELPSCDDFEGSGSCRDEDDYDECVVTPERCEEADEETEQEDEDEDLPDYVPPSDKDEGDDKAQDTNGNDIPAN